MGQPVAEQLAFDSLVPNNHHKNRQHRHTQCEHMPVAQVVLDVQAAHLGRTFDYLIDAKDDDSAQPGTLVRVRFGGRRVTGVIWARVEHSDAPSGSLKYIERVLSTKALVSSTTRRDIENIAKAYGGTCANILRLALPPRVARIEREQAGQVGTQLPIFGTKSSAQAGQLLTQLREDLGQAYPKLDMLSSALARHTFATFALDALPGPEQWELTCLWIVVQALQAGKPVVVVLPDVRHMESLSRQFQRFGLQSFAPRGDGETSWSGHFVLMGSSMAPAERYRSYVALSQGQVSCVLGLRAAMYAPVEGAAVFAIVDDAAYQNTDGMAPYANARGVLRLRAKLHNGIFLTISHARSARSQWETSTDAEEVTSGVTGPAQALVPSREAIAARLPWVRWLNRDELARLADPAIGARIPHTAVTVLTKALQAGPVLLSIPQDSQSQALTCASCHKMARCPRCTGPIVIQTVGHAPRCAWCGHAAVNWQCKDCGSDRMRLVRVGATGTAQELRLLFKGVPITISTPAQPRGIVESIDDRPRLVIATPGAEPRIEKAGSGLVNGYQAIAIVDAWTSLYAWGVDARLDMLTSWMQIVSLCQSREKGGQVLILGETDPSLAQALMTWRPDLLSAAELEDRTQTGLPPSTAAASVWGSRDAVDWALEQAGASGAGDISSLNVAGEHVPSVWGPAPIAPESKLTIQPLEGTMDRVRALVRVVPSQRDLLAQRLHTAVSAYVATRGRGELKFCMDPKDLT